MLFFLIARPDQEKIPLCVLCALAVQSLSNRPLRSRRQECEANHLVAFHKKDRKATNKTPGTVSAMPTSLE